SGRQIMVVNAGGGSLHLSLYDWQAQQEVAAEYIDWTRQDDDSGVHAHADALKALLERLDVSRVAAVGHRIVHGGARFQHAVLIDREVRAEIERLVELAPLHNKPALEGIRAVEIAFRDVPQVAAFDTTFHRTLAPPAYMYPLPYEWYERWGLRRFGFHGLSHAYCAERAATLLGRRPEEIRLVNCHLGSGCSLAAIDGGKSVATTMGFTPLEGLMMATRSGSVDPGLLLYLLTQQRLDAERLEDALNHRSGLQGIAGVSDMRDLLEARSKGDARAALAFDMYTLRLREGIGAMATHLGGLDALVFTDGVGENAAEVRQATVEPLGWLGVELDADANAAAKPDVDVATIGSRVRVLVIHTREELMVARETRRVLEALGSG
ncbi:MAG TPA: acetate kinase, partial [Chloroflexota bacterium]|nr:acetate kinase [Chloroflexota bacterium]